MEIEAQRTHAHDRWSRGRIHAGDGLAVWLLREVARVMLPCWPELA
jgi:hypothetical protein